MAGTDPMRHTRSHARSDGSVAGISPSARQQPANTDLDDPSAVLEAFCIVGMLLALIALMPEFDGREGRGLGSAQMIGAGR